MTKKHKTWVTLESRFLVFVKDNLILKQSSNNLNFLNYVKNYKQIFKKTCNTANLMSNKFRFFIEKSVNKNKLAWHIVRQELGSNINKNALYKCLYYNCNNNLELFLNEQHTHEHYTRFRNNCQFPVYSLMLYDKLPTIWDSHCTTSCQINSDSFL